MKTFLFLLFICSVLSNYTQFANEEFISTYNYNYTIVHFYGEQCYTVGLELLVYCSTSDMFEPISHVFVNNVELTPDLSKPFFPLNYIKYFRHHRYVKYYNVLSINNGSIVVQRGKACYDGPLEIDILQFQIQEKNCVDTTIGSIIMFLLFTLFLIGIPVLLCAVFCN